MNRRIILAVLLPFLALALQWELWRWISPFVWFLFFPTLFFSARLAGRWGGLASTIISIFLVWFFFIPPQLSWHIQNPHNFTVVPMFLLMGYLLSESQERLRHAQHNVAEALQQTRCANQEILQLYQKTLELDELKSQFFANVSHELRTPLTLIISPLTQRLAATQGLSVEERREDEMMLRNARLLYRHVCDLLDAAKLESGHMVADYARLDLGKLIRATAAQFDSLARDKGIGYHIAVPSHLDAEVDGEKVQRILLNLLSNAFKFTPLSGRIELRLSTEGQHALLEVLDNGPGVPLAMRESIFERFRQGEGGAQRFFGGTGLGLSIAKEFVELHGGRIEIGEAPGGGARFSVHLPLHAPQGTQIQAEPSQIDPLLRDLDGQTADATRRATPRPPLEHLAAPLVLVVEDNADMNDFIREALSPHYRVVSAYDGHEGLERAIALQPQLILSDVMMPLLSGDLMAKELRNRPETADIPIIMLSARDDDAQRLQLLKVGVQDYLGKPFSVEELLARVHGLIQERQRFNERFNASESRFESTFEQAAVGLSLVAPDGHWLRVNRKLCQIVGYTQDELLRTDFQSITHADDLDTDLAFVRQLLAGEIEHYAMEKRFLRKDGAVVWINLTVALARNAQGQPDYFISVVEDIQQRKQTEAALRASEQALQAAQRLAGIGSWEWEIASNTHRWSEEIFNIYGLDPQAGPLLYPEVQHCFSADSWVRLTDAVDQCLAQGQSYVCEAEVQRADGETRWISARGEATRDAQQKIIALHGTVQDITQRVQTEKEIRQLNADLERRVLERTAELTSANEELDSFAYAVSHDLRAPLRAMRGFSQALDEDYGDRLDGQAKVYLSQISIATQKMNDLIDGILLLSRSTRGELRQDSIDLSALALRLLQELAANEPGRQVKIEIAPNLRARADARMLEVLLGNLLGNAWKYTSKTEDATIRVYAGKLAGLSGFCIADNGAGFDMQHADKLFQPFRRLHRQEEFPGLGIGLATVQRIVRRLGGEIRAEGHPQQGATFCFSIPDLAEGEAS